MQHLIWLPKSVLNEMRRDADHWYDRETGGTFMGYWADGRTAVVTKMIPGGPNAIRERTSFLPDQEWQQAQIADHYDRSARLDTYLGDWHTHPEAVFGSLSWKDRACLKHIISTPSARNSTPIMMLMSGNPDNWVLSSWVARLRSCFRVNWLWVDEATFEVHG